MLKKLKHSTIWERVKVVVNASDRRSYLQVLIFSRFGPKYFTNF